MKFFARLLLAFALCVPANANAPGFVGFSTTHSIIAYDGTWNAFPQLDTDGAGNRLALFTSGANEGYPGFLQAKASSNGTTWSAPVTVDSSPSGFLIGAGDVTYIPALGFVVVYAEESLSNPNTINNFVVVCTISAGSPSCGSRTAIAKPSGWLWFIIIGKIVTLPNGHFMLPIYGQLSSQSGSVTNTALLFNTDATATTWPNLIMVATGNSTNFWSESGWVIVPTGYPNAGRVIGYMRNDDASNVNSGYWLTYSDTPETSFQAPTKAFAELSPYVGKPMPVFVPTGTNGAIFLMFRWQPNTSPLYVGQSFTGYTVSFDQGQTYLPIRNFAPGNIINVLVQFWYASCTWRGPTAIVACAIGLAFNNQTTVAWTAYQEFHITQPQFQAGLQ